MPLYEYHCADCSHNFEIRRALSEAATDVTCPECAGQHTRRVFTPVIAFSNGHSGSAVIGGSGCAGCAATHCAGCTFTRRAS
ncbi:MAG: hypothetical protein FOGNACKC_04932 [Anaerolineae bacterium]|nr:hypothetical protein [Anaerolineae bacterium]